MNILIGKDKWGDELRWEGSPNLHLCITGDSGCGKSYLLKQLIPQAALQGAKVIIFDTQGDFSEEDAAIFPDWDRCRLQLVDIRDKSFHLNVFQPCLAEEAPEDIAERLAGLFASALELGSSQRALLNELIYNGLEAKCYTNISHLGEDVQAKAMDDQAARRMAPKIMGILRKIPNGDSPFPWNLDTNGILVVNLQHIFASNIRAALMELMAGEIASEKMTLLPSTAVQRPPLILVFDECQHLSLKNGTVISQILREGRKYGLYGWFSTQWAKKSELKQLGQAGMKIFFRTQTDVDALNVAVGQLGVQDSEKKKLYKRLLPQLSVGEFLTLHGRDIRHCHPGIDFQ